MKSAKELLAKNHIPPHWPSLLHLAIEEVFEIMLGSKLAGYAGPAPTHDLTAMVGLAGDLCGVLTVRCAQQSASRITARMLGGAFAENEQDVSQHVWDALGEMSNMIAGNFKNKLDGIADRCLLSVPTIISGQDYKLRPLANSETLEVILAFEGQPIIVTLDVHA
ncbi:MAG TPA: chemotaxis protein CheX [Terriglobales bacterium]|jgi:chemotaxis protein CheX